MSIRRDGSVAVIHMRAGRANAMSATLLAALSDAVAEAAVITGDGRFFSAGLALPDLVGLPRPRMAEFMSSVDAAMMDMLTMPMPTVAAIDGPAIAGGCVLALMCDVRVMGSTAGRIGLSEVKLSIGLPAIVIEALRHRVPPSSATRIALAGELLEPGDALAIGLVDEVTDQAGVLPRAVALAAGLSGSKAAFAHIKRSLLRPVVAEIDRVSDRELDLWLDTWFSEDGQEKVRSVVAQLRAPVHS